MVREGAGIRLGTVLPRRAEARIPHPHLFFVVSLLQMREIFAFRTGRGRWAGPGAAGRASGGAAGRFQRCRIQINGLFCHPFYSLALSLRRKNP